MSFRKTEGVPLLFEDELLPSWAKPAHATLLGEEGLGAVRIALRADTRSAPTGFCMYRMADGRGRSSLRVLVLTLIPFLGKGWQSVVSRLTG